MRLGHPQWLPYISELRFGTGIEFDCPTHGAFCRLALYFMNPLDGRGPDAPEGTELFHQAGGGLGTICLWPRVRTREHGEFYVLNGAVDRLTLPELGSH